jgi:REP element-mobilizing transposase RayT
MKALAIGGTADHVHALLSLPGMMSFSKAVQLIKGGSSKWIHDTFSNQKKFAWQEGYGAFSAALRRYRRKSLTSTIKKNTIGERASTRSFWSCSINTELNTIRVTSFDDQWPGSSRKEPSRR